MEEEKETHRTKREAAERYIEYLGKLDVLIKSRKRELPMLSGKERETAEAQIARLIAERRKRLSVIELLPAKDCDLLLRLYVDGSTFKELARHFDRSYDWVKKNKRAALERLGEILFKV